VLSDLFDHCLSRLDAPSEQAHIVTTIERTLTHRFASVRPSGASSWST